MNATADAFRPDELWGLIMRMADPSDLLRTILNNAGDRSEVRQYKSGEAVMQQTMILTGCTVVIHQHVLADPLTPPPEVAA